MKNLIESLSGTEVNEEESIFNSFSARKAAISDLVGVMMIPLYETDSVYSDVK